MEWVEGELLDSFIRHHLGESQKLRELATAWQQMCAVLERAGLAHGDLQHGNVLVSNGRLVLVDQAPRHSSAAAIIAAEVAEHAFGHMHAPVTMLTALDTSVPYSETMENFILPNEDKIVRAVKSVLEHKAAAA